MAVTQWLTIVMHIVVVSIYSMVVTTWCGRIVLTASASIYWLGVISETLLVNIVFMYVWNSNPSSKVLNCFVFTLALNVV